MAQGLLGNTASRRIIRQIPDCHMGRTACRPDGRRNGFGPRSIAAMNHDDRTLPRQFGRDGCTNARRAARYKCRATCQR
ncbi:hypothetical protein NSE01_33660 [Novosphingobium sediminis]|uniref:Uncharacterized protein n=1 Tax=Novosphingobium sediminis TaxID=707214 RepID=A0A512APA9_9SPHN|nr:hypothetical protein NSE01_33660 [Novosphingobium sediminis]